MSERQKRLLRAIEEAFAGVELGDGVSLHETVVIDLYGSLEEQRAARAPDEKRDWRKLVTDPELVRINGVGGLSFYDAAGLRFHLPAYLSLAVKKFRRKYAPAVLDSLLFHLTHFCEYNLDRFSILDGSQRQCVREVLMFLRDEYDPDSAELEEAIRGYWSSSPEAVG